MNDVFQCHGRIQARHNFRGPFESWWVFWLILLNRRNDKVIIVINTSHAVHYPDSTQVSCALTLTVIMHSLSELT